MWISTIALTMAVATFFFFSLFHLGFVQSNHFRLLHDRIPQPMPPIYHNNPSRPLPELPTTTLHNSPSVYQTNSSSQIQRRQHLRLAAPIPLGYEFTAREDFNFGTLRPTELAQFQTPTVYEEASDSTVPVERYAPTPLNRSRYLWTDGMQHDNRVAEMSSESQEGVNAKHFGEGEYNEGAEEEKREEAEEAEEEEEEEEEDCKETRVDPEDESREPVTLPQEETEGETLGQAVDFQFEDEMHEL